VTEEAMRRAGLHTIADVARASDAVLEKLVGSYAARIKLLARGIDDRPVVPDAEAKSIGAENTFARDIAEPGALRTELDALSERVAVRARAEGMLGYTVNLKARYADFTTVTRAMTLPAPTAESVAIRDAARELLETRLDRGGRALRLLGVSLSHLVHAEEMARDLFSTPRTTRNRTLDGVMDALRERFGPAAIQRGMKRGRRRGAAPDDE
jgi:DNA polymerase-4